jgi:DNA modification methylase
MDYTDFLKTKKKNVIESGFDINKSDLNSMLFDFQKFTVKRALKHGKYAIFADTGQGKTAMQLSIAHQVSLYTKKPVLILAPLAVTGQTINEGEKFGIEVKRWNGGHLSNIQISNYEQLDNIDTSLFGCICLDESSILKNETGKFRNLLIERFKHTPYKFCFSASPSPNDPTELGNHAEFLDVMSFDEMLAMYFVNDSKKQKQGSKWRLKGHAIERFYQFVSTWAIMYSHPKDIGFPNSKFDLPELEIIEKIVQTPLPDGVLFPGEAVSATDYHSSLRDTQDQRICETIRIINQDIPKGEPVIIWTKQNPESDKIYRMLKDRGFDCRNVQGSDSPEKKERDLLGFAKCEYQILITKESIASMGLNYQHCGYQIFNSIDFSFERTYQALRRSWRFGRKEKVTAYMVTTDRMINVSKTQKEKQKNFQNMQKQMASAINKNLNNELLTINIDTHDIKNDDYWLMRGDCVQRIKEVPDNSVDIIVFSPPFADLYVYSNKIEDMGNVSDYNQFKEQFRYLVKELKRVIKPGRLICVHSMNLPTLKSRDGYIGLRRFNAMIGDIFEEYDMFLHSDFAVWKDPLLAAVRTKTKGLAHKTLLADSSQVRMGIYDAVQCFKTKEENEIPIEHDLLRSYKPMHEYDKFPTNVAGFNEFWGYDSGSKYDRETQYSHHIWQRYASPIWMDINASDTLQWSTARGENDEKHICPLQLPVIERLLTLYSKEGETLLSPFGGIGSEGYQALKMKRKSISIELKESYFNVNIKNHRSAVEQNGQLKMFLI